MREDEALGLCQRVRTHNADRTLTEQDRPRRLVFAAHVPEAGKNYLGQLRIYSYVDLVLLLIAAGATVREIGTCSLLWFGFLIYLEWLHRDAGRLRWPWAAWVAPWAAAALWAHNPGAVAAFFVVCVGYTLKKRVPALASLSPMTNGAVKATLLLLVAAATLPFAALVWAATAIRNLLGDMRDIEKDRREHVRTIPVRLGLQRDIRWLYPLGLALTTALWTATAGLPAWLLVCAWAVQAATYRLTPR